MKEPNAQAVAAACGRLIAAQARETLHDALPDLLAYTPMHWQRRLQRRVNNAERLARVVAAELSLPVRGVVRCRRKTQKQSLLTVDQRGRNVRGAFQVPKKLTLTGIHVGLVDDTMTTGATANEIAGALHEAGASRVTVLLAARGVSD